MITLSGSNYPCLERISMVPKMFEPLRFDCSCFTTHIDKEREVIDDEDNYDQLHSRQPIYSDDSGIPISKKNGK